MASSKPEKAQTCEIESMNLSKANNHLAVQLYRVLAEERTNVFFSPFTISTLMITLFCAAEGETAEEIRFALGSPVIIKEGLGLLIRRYMEDLVKYEASHILSCANCMIIHKDLEVTEEFKYFAREGNKALLIETDFQSDSEKVISQINEWVKQKTNHMIPKIIESLESAPFVALLNAVYFTGTWHDRFDKKLTSLQEFYNHGKLDEAKPVDMMQMEGYFLCTEFEGCQVLELPYIGKEIKMLIFIPRSVDGLENLEEYLTTSLVLDLCQNMNLYKAAVLLPRFRLEYSKSLIPALNRLGVSKLFCSNAELQTAFNFSDKFALDIFHEAVFDVNEDGTNLVPEPRIHRIEYGINPATVFNADHPFAFVIYHKKSNLILFMGRVTEL